MTRVDRFDAKTGGFLSQVAHASGAEEESSIYRMAVGGPATGEPLVYSPTFYVQGSGGPHVLVNVRSGSGALKATWTGAGTPAKSLREVEDIAVDNSSSLSDWAAGDVYAYVPIVNEHESTVAVYVFHPGPNGEEQYVTSLPEPEPEPGVHVPLSTGFESGSIAVDEANGDVLVMDYTGGPDGVGRYVVDEYEPTVFGQYAFLRRLSGTKTAPLESIRGLAVDAATGDVYVAEVGAVDQFSPTGVLLGRLTETPSGPFGNVVRVAVDPEGKVYVAALKGEPNARGVEVEVGAVDMFGPDIVTPDVTTGSASRVGVHGGVLQGTVNPDEAGPAACRFEWGATPAFGHSAACRQEGIEGGKPVPVEAEVGGLEPDTTYYYRLEASNEHGTNTGETSQDQQFTTRGPGVESPSVSAVTASSATLRAEVDANGAATTYYFEYGTSAAYGSVMPALPGVEIGGEGAQPVSVHLQGLSPGTVYHYRVVAVSEPGGEPVTVESVDGVFATQSASTAVSHSDGRKWEMVTPPNKHGAAIYGIGVENGPVIQAAAAGSGITFATTAPLVVNPAGSRSVEMQQGLSTRAAPGSWVTADVATPHYEGASGVALGHASEYKLFAGDLSVGLVEPAGDTPLPPLPAGSEKTVYLREAGGGYRALVTSENVPPGVEFGGDEELNAGFTFVSASPDLSHVVLSSSVQLEEGAPSNGGLYEWAGGRLRLVSVLPDGTPTAKAALGRVGNGQGGFVLHAISNEGSRIVWESGGEQNHYYLRDMSLPVSVQIDAPQQGVSAPRQEESEYWAASGDGSRVFFTSTGRLTAGSTAPEAGEHGDLYVFEVTSAPGEPLAGSLRDLTVDGGVNESADVLGVLGASEDGAYVYFVAKGVLGDATAGESSGANLYVVHYEAAAHGWGAPVFLAALSAGDANDWQFGRMETARVSPNGRYLAFMSQASLTGYENRDAVSGARDEEVYLYDAVSGRLVCASCDPTGARPVGVSRGHEEQGPLWDAARAWGEETVVAGNIPSLTNNGLGTADYQSRYLSDEGRLFFDSSDALVPADVNGQVDVYEYEPAGVGGCVPPTYGAGADVVYEEGAGGCVGLISAGTSSQESAFLDASESGGDVFFLTVSQLSPQDYDSSYDIYDAHECAAAAPCAPVVVAARPPCATGDACKAAPTPQPAFFGAPSSETFSGAGNVTPAPAVEPKAKPVKCGRGSVKKRGVCVRKRPKKARRAKKANRRMGK